MVTLLAIVAMVPRRASVRVSTPPRRSELGTNSPNRSALRIMCSPPRATSRRSSRLATYATRRMIAILSGLSDSQPTKLASHSVSVSSRIGSQAQPLSAQCADAARSGRAVTECGREVGASTG